MLTELANIMRAPIAQILDLTYTKINCCEDVITEIRIGIEDHIIETYSAFLVAEARVKEP